MVDGSTLPSPSYFLSCLQFHICSILLLTSLSFTWDFCSSWDVKKAEIQLEDTVTEGSFPPTEWMLKSAGWEAAWWKMTVLFPKCMLTVSPHTRLSWLTKVISYSTEALEQGGYTWALGLTSLTSFCEAEKVTFCLSESNYSECHFPAVGVTVVPTSGVVKKPGDSIDSSLIWQLLRENCVKHCSWLWLAAVNSPSLYSQSSQSNWGDRWHQIDMQYSVLYHMGYVRHAAVSDSPPFICSALICITHWGPTFEG